jgi:hypothetical protein
MIDTSLQDLAYWRETFGATQMMVQAITNRTSGSVSTWFDSQSSKKRQTPIPSFAVDLLTLYYGDSSLTSWRQEVADRMEEFREKQSAFNKAYQAKNRKRSIG